MPKLNYFWKKLSEILVGNVNKLKLKMKTINKNFELITNGRVGKVQIGKHIIDVTYYFTEEDTIYCEVLKSKILKKGYCFFTHYKSLEI